MNFTSHLDDNLNKSSRKSLINFLFNDREDHGSDIERSQSDITNNKLKTVL